mgnify:CR=1 FL=1
MRGIDKKVLGAFLGDRDQFNQDVLRAFASTFDFSQGTYVSCLRQYLTSFFVPGEAQIISRVLEIFAEKYCTLSTNHSFKNNDAAFVLAYSIVLLNVDQYNRQVKVRA